jgi:hypothetical protein
MENLSDSNETYFIQKLFIETDALGDSAAILNMPLSQKSLRTKTFYSLWTRTQKCSD